MINQVMYHASTISSIDSILNHGILSRCLTNNKVWDEEEALPDEMTNETYDKIIWCRNNCVYMFDNFDSAIEQSIISSNHKDEDPIVIMFNSSQYKLENDIECEHTNLHAFVSECSIRSSDIINFWRVNYETKQKLFDIYYEYDNDIKYENFNISYINDFKTLFNNFEIYCDLIEIVSNNNNWEFFTNSCYGS